MRARGSVRPSALIRSAKPSGAGGRSGAPPAVIAPSTRSQAGLRKLDRASDVDSDELAVALDEAPGDEHVLDVGGVGLRDQAADRICHRHHVQPTPADDDHVGLLARGQRADAMLQAHRVRAVDRAPAQRVAHAERPAASGSWLRRLKASLSHAALELQADAHLAEHVAGVARRRRRRTGSGACRAPARGRSPDGPCPSAARSPGCRRPCSRARPGGAGCARRACCSARAPGRPRAARGARARGCLRSATSPTSSRCAARWESPAPGPSAPRRSSARTAAGRPPSAPRPSSPARRR